MANKLFVRILIVKILNVLLATTCFSSFVYADDFSYLIDNQKKEAMINYRDNKIDMCIKDNMSKISDNNQDYAKAYKTARLAADFCKCAIDTVIYKKVGKDFVLNNDLEMIQQKLDNVIDDKEQMILLINECKPKE